MSDEALHGASSIELEETTNSAVEQPPLPHAPIATLGGSSSSQMFSVEDERPPTSKWSSPRSAYTVESVAQQYPSVSSVHTSGQQLPGSVREVYTSRQLRADYSGVKPPRTYMCLSVMTTLCCCLFLGIAAIAQSTEVESETKAGVYIVYHFTIVF